MDFMGDKATLLETGRFVQPADVRRTVADETGRPTSEAAVRRRASGSPPRPATPRR